MKQLGQWLTLSSENGKLEAESKPENPQSRPSEEGGPKPPKTPAQGGPPGGEAPPSGGPPPSGGAPPKGPPSAPPSTGTPGSSSSIPEQLAAIHRLYLSFMFSNTDKPFDIKDICVDSKEDLICKNEKNLEIFEEWSNLLKDGDSTTEGIEKFCDADDKVIAALGTHSTHYAFYELLRALRALSSLH